MNITRSANLLFILCLIFSGFWYVGSALTGLLLITLVVVGLRSTFTRQVWQDFALTKLMLIYIAWLFIVALNSPVPNTSMITLPVLAGLPVMYLMATNSLIFAEIWKSLRVIFFVSAVGLAAWAVFQVINNVGYGHAVGPLVDRNAFAALMNLLWFPASYLFIITKFKTNPWQSTLEGIGLFVISLALFATASRGGIGIWLLLLPFLLWASYQFNKSKQLIAAILLIATLAFFCSATLLHSSVVERPIQLAALAQDASTNARLMMWQSTTKMALAHPFIGTGWGTFVGYYPAYRLPIENSTSGLSAHNDYLQLAAEGGIPVLLLQLGVVFGLLFQLKRVIKYVATDADLESVALLLGVLAVFIQAGVNFIFCFAFMNLLVGLYLARVAQLTDTVNTVRIYQFKKIRSWLKQLFTGFIILLIVAPFGLHLIAQACLTGIQPGLKVINFFKADISAYEIASFITIIRPVENLAQEYLTQSAEHVLTNLARETSIMNNDHLQLLNETLVRLENLRANSANNPNYGVREVELLITYHTILDSTNTDSNILKGKTAYSKAYQIIGDNLKADPYHAKSMIALSRLQVVEGHTSNALHTLNLAEQHILTRRDQQLILVETLRQLAAPRIITELDDIEKELNLVQSDSETGKPLVLPVNFSELLDAKLNSISEKIKNVR